MVIVEKSDNIPLRPRFLRKCLCKCIHVYRNILNREAHSTTLQLRATELRKTLWKQGKAILEKAILSTIQKSLHLICQQLSRKSADHFISQMFTLSRDLPPVSMTNARTAAQILSASVATPLISARKFV